MSLQDFRCLGNGISLYEPDNQENVSLDIEQEAESEAARADHPVLIILCTWLGGATSRRIQKYTQGYHRMWPKSSILLIRTVPSEYAFQTDKALARKLQPAHHEIRRLAVEADSSSSRRRRRVHPRVLLHIFSNGGAGTAVQLVASMNGILSALGRPGPLALHQVVLDSCPGDPGIGATYRAAAHSAPRGLLRPLACAALYLVVVGIAGLEALGARRRLGRTIGGRLNDRATFAPAARRLYLASEADGIVDLRDVHVHRAEAEAAGLTTEGVVFRRAGHCCLVLEDEVLYWHAITSCWDGAKSPGQTLPESAIGKEESTLNLTSVYSTAPQIRSRL